MTSPSVRESFDLAKVAESGVQAILEGLRIDRANVLEVDFEPTSRHLEVVLARPEAAEHVSAFVHSMGRTHRLLPKKRLHEHRVEGLEVLDIDAALATSDDLQVLGEGLTSLRGDLLALFRFFEGCFRDLARDFAAEEQHYPVMVPSEVLAEVGYLDNFPQHATFCSHLPDSVPVLESVSQASASQQDRSDSGNLMQTLGKQLSEPRHVLTPGVCLPCYRQQRDLVLAPEQVKTLTMQNHVFRYEGANFRPLSRGWDFTVRDIVFFGAGDRLKQLRLDVIERTVDLCRELDLEITVELAHDPFFLDASRDKAIYQRMGEVKYELLFPLPYQGSSLAAASFNLHRHFYTGVYDTRQADGELAESACMGFGLDRWLYGFLSQKGLDPKRWPEKVTGSLR